MKEVSCRFFDVLLRDLRKREIDPQALVEGTPYSPADLANKDERVEWSALVRILRNGRELWTHDDFLRLGERSTEGAVVKFIGVVARIRFSVAGFYQWVTAPDGVASQMITCVKTISKYDGPGRIVVDFVLSPGYETSEEFFLITQGTYAAMPRMLGAPAAKVRSTPTENGARFLIQFEESRGPISAARRLVTAPFTMKAAATELADAHSSLIARYEELDAAREQVERHREMLDAAYRLGQEIAAQRDLERVVRIAATALLARAGVAGVRISIQAYRDVVEEGGTTREDPVLSVKLPGTKPGVIALWGTIGPGLQQFVDLVAPTLALAVDNAVAYHDLAEYQAGLERLVEQRTTELRTAGEELAALVEQLKVAQASREKFFGNISHEIRTPLSLILLAAGDIERRAGEVLDRRSRDGLVGISEGARKLLRLVDELLLLAAGQMEKLTLSVEATDTAALLRQIVGAWRPAAEAADLQLDLRAPDSLVLEVDPTALERVVSNLVSNAVKYTPKGGRIDLELAVEGGDVRLSVSDTGRGIDPELAGRLFGRFERAAGDDRRKSGTGIGLALVKQLVEAHGGTITAIPRKPVGTELRVLLPAALIRTGARGAATTQLRTTHAPGDVSKLRSGQLFTPPGLSLGTIVIAEDEPRLAQAIAQLLSDQYTVVVALDGAAALELVKQHQPQLLITDVDMPGLTGIELARRFREETGDRLAPIIILSAMIDLNTRLAGLEAGAIDYVGKPFEPKELLARVDAQFRMRELAVRLHRAEQVSSLGILTSGLAHELRNPANGVVNSLEPLLEYLPKELTAPDTDVGQLFEAIKTSSEQILALVNQLLGFHGSAELAMRPAVVSDLVARSVRLASNALKDVEVREHLAAKGTLMCAPALMVQVLTNLVENAGHAAGPGGWVEIRTTLRDDRLAFEVTDSGSGVPPQLRERIFEPFFTTKPQGRGTGLGLSVARTVIQRHHGTLELRQREGRTAFVIELPANTNLVRSLAAL